MEKRGTALVGPFVLDASVALHWAFPDERTGLLPPAQEAAIWIASFPAHVPYLFWYELRNVLIAGERRGRLTGGETSVFLANQAALALEFHAPREAALLTLARRHRLSVYDAAYLELAMRLQAPLATLDAALVAAARAERHPLVGA